MPRGQGRSSVCFRRAGWPCLLLSRAVCPWTAVSSLPRTASRRKLVDKTADQTAAALFNRPWSAGNPTAWARPRRPDRRPPPIPHARRRQQTARPSRRFHATQQRRAAQNAPSMRKDPLSSIRRRDRGRAADRRRGALRRDGPRRASSPAGRSRACSTFSACGPGSRTGVVRRQEPRRVPRSPTVAGRHRRAPAVRRGAAALAEQSWSGGPVGVQTSGRDEHPARALMPTRC